MAGVKGKSGGRRRNAGRKPKEKNQALVEKLKPYEETALKKLGSAVNRGDAWALKLFFEYCYGKPIQRQDVTSGGQPIQVTPISFFSDEEE